MSADGLKAIEEGAERNELSKRAAVLATARILAFAMSFLLPLVLVRTLSQMNFGLYKQAFQVLASAVALPGLGLSTSAFYFMPRQPEKKPQIAMNVVIFYFSVGILVALLFALYPGWSTWVFKSGELKAHIPLLGVASLLWLLSSFLETVTVAAGDIRSAFVFSLVIQTTKILLLLGAATAFNSVGAIVWAATLQGALQCAILFFYLRRRFGQFWRAFDLPLFKAQLAYALPFGLSGLAATVQADLHNYFVSHYFDSAMFAIYSVGCFQLPLLTVLVDSVGSVVIPRFARLEMLRDYQGIVALWIAAIRKMAFFFTPVCLLLLIMRREFIITLFTRNYEAAAPVFAINLICLFLFINLTGSVILAFEDFKYFRLALYLTLIPITGAALYFGIHVAGLVGAITAVTLIRVLDVSVNILVLRRRLGLALRDIRRLSPILKIGAAAALAGLATLVMKPFVVEFPMALQLAACSTLFGLVYSGAVFVVGAVTEEERGELQNLALKYYRLGSVRLGFSSVGGS